MFQTIPLLMPDAVAWAIPYLKAALDARPESYASSVQVRKDVGKTIPTRLVTVRDDSGQRGTVTKTCSLGLNIYAESDAVCADLANLVVALLEASPGSGPVVGHSSSSGPYPVPEESTKPHRYASVVLAVRGSAL